MAPGPVRGGSYAALLIGPARTLSAAEQGVRPAGGEHPYELGGLRAAEGCWTDRHKLTAGCTRYGADPIVSSRRRGPAQNGRSAAV